MKENWYALYLAIFKNLDAESAVSYIKYGRETTKFKKNFDKDRMCIKRSKLKFTYEEYLEVMKLKETHTWKEMSQICSINSEKLRAKILRFEKKLEENEPTKAIISSSLNKKSILV